MSSQPAVESTQTVAERTAAPARPMGVSFFGHVISTFGITILQQFFGLGRQILIAAYFGLSREFDGYLLIYALSNIVVFNLSGVFDTVAVSRLAQIRERDGEEAFWRSSNWLLRQSVGGGLIFAGGLYGLLIILLPVVAAGFTAAERAFVVHLAAYFLPWIAVVLPYYAVSAHLKARWGFHWVFGAELGVIVISTLVLWLRHDSVDWLPLAYGIGYFGALGMLLTRRGFNRPPRQTSKTSLLRGMANQSLANQIGSAAGLVDRYFQSYLAVGGISVLGYTGLIVNNLSSLINFREIYVVPLAAERGRDDRLQRMLMGSILVSVPCAGFIMAFAHPIITLLFQRGNFTPEAASLTADVLRIVAISLAISPLLGPMARLFQIVDRISYSHVLYLVSLTGTAALQYLFVFRFGWDVRGAAWAQVANSALVTLVVTFLVRQCNVEIKWGGILGAALFAVVVTAAAIGLSATATLAMTALPMLIVGSALYGVIVAAAYFAIRQRLLFIIGRA